MTFEIVVGTNYMLLTVLSALAALVSRLLVFLLDGVTSWGQAAINAAAMIGAAVLTFCAVWIKVRWDKYKFNAAQTHKTSSALSESAVRREELVDKRADNLFDDLTAFYTTRDKEKEGVIGLLKENLQAAKDDAQRLMAEKELVITQQRELIAAQALTIQQLQHPQ